MTSQTHMKQGDFTALASAYAQYRPSYSHSVTQGILGITGKPAAALDFVDVGAGTGIWTRLVAQQGCKSVVAVEPNDAMRKEGAAANGSLHITWQAGSGEETGLPDQSADLLSMASSFHWADFASATSEFHRVLKPGGHFVMLWNPRHLESNPLLVEIENQISVLEPATRRVSSGKSKHVDGIAAKLAACDLFEDMVYLEGMHTALLTKEQYLGVWKSVNDVRAQLGEIKFQSFLNFIDDKIKTPTIACPYQTRAWIVRKREA